MRVIASFAAVATLAASIGALSAAAEAQTYLASPPGHFLFREKNYCFSPNGWAGRGWYVCGFAQRRGYGYGGPIGRAGHRALVHYGHPHGHGFGGPRFNGAYGGFRRGHGWRHHHYDGWPHHDGWHHGYGFRHGFGGVFHHPMGGHHGAHQPYGGFRPPYGDFHHGGRAHGHPFRHHH